MRRVIGGLTAVLLGMGVAGCGGNEPSLESGTYASGVANEGTPLEASTLRLDLAGGTAQLELADGSVVALTLSERDEADQVLGCPGNFGAERLQTFDVEPDPLLIGDLSLSSPLLTSGCFEGDREAALRGRTGEIEQVFLFERN